jgi:hypothetical protein
MYVNISLQITIGNKIRFQVAKYIKIDKSIHKLANTSVIHLPREFRANERVDFKEANLLSFMKIGDSIKIELGYDGNLKTEFEGYLKNIGAEIPTVLECEDEMYQLKRTSKFNKTFSSVSLKEVLSLIAPGYEIICPTVTFGKYSIENATAFEVLEGLREFGIRASFKGKVLYAGMMIDFKTLATHYFEFGMNIRESSDLKYLTEQNKAVKVKAISLQKGSSKKVTYEYGEAINGERTLHAPTNLNLTELKKWTEDYYKNIVFEGYEGTIDGWCYPRTEPGDTLKLVDPNYPDQHRDGKFLIESVEITVDDEFGIKRKNAISVGL